MRPPFPGAARADTPRSDRSGLVLDRQGVDTPVGSVIMFAGDLSNAVTLAAVINRGWLPCAGQAVAQANYPDLFHAIGPLYTPQGAAQGQFCVPDYRGQFLRGLATDSSQDPGFAYRTAPPGGSNAQSVGSSQAPMVQLHQHDYQALEAVEVAQSGPSGAAQPAAATPTTNLLNSGGTGSLTGEETRPQNIYVNFLIKATKTTFAIGVSW